jgi:hypothetical protein
LIALRSLHGDDDRALHERQGQRADRADRRWRKGRILAADAARTARGPPAALVATIEHAAHNGVHFQSEIVALVEQQRGVAFINQAKECGCGNVVISRRIRRQSLDNLQEIGLATATHWAEQG